MVPLDPAPAREDAGEPASRRRWMGGLVAMALVGAMAACSGGDDGDATSGDESTTTIEADRTFTSVPLDADGDGLIDVETTSSTVGATEAIATTQTTRATSKRATATTLAASATTVPPATTAPPTTTGGPTTTATPTTAGPPCPEGQQGQPPYCVDPSNPGGGTTFPTTFPTPTFPAN